MFEKEGSQASTTIDNKHAHLLNKTNIQMCQGCHRFFIISYEKNEKGEAVETGYELDIQVKSSGIVSPQSAWETPEATIPYRQRKEDNRRELTCF